MKNLQFVDRKDSKIKTEQVPLKGWLNFLYTNKWGQPIRFIVGRLSLISRIVGWLTSRSFSKKHIQPFVEQYKIDASEFLNPISSFSSFNDFFTRKLKQRTLSSSPVVMPCDGRHFFFPSVNTQTFLIKNKSFDLKSFLQDETLFEQFHDGQMLISRLAPVDYHRYHFPTESTVISRTMIPGALYSVHPLALSKRLANFWENKRCITVLESPVVGRYVMVEVGATHVGSIIHTSSVGSTYKKGDEKGYFSFGGSCLVTLFAPDTLNVDEDLLNANRQQFELKAGYGESLAQTVSFSDK